MTDRGDGPTTGTRVLVDRADVIARCNRLRQRAQKQIEADGRPEWKQDGYWDGYIVGLEDLMDALYGFCAPPVAIPEVKP